ncbi:MAG: EamA family transporter [Methylobacteriaceae bacterium]|nr:EamA family transporter [Methylobacteriaceae bacterium]
MTFAWLWVVFTLIAALLQTARNTMQRQLTGPLGAVGATHVRFLFGLPFAIVFLAIVTLVTGLAIPAPNAASLGWTMLGAMTQIVATALMLAAMRERSFVTTIAYTKTEPVQAAIFGLIFLGDRLTPLLTLAIAIATTGVMVMSTPGKEAAAPAGERRSLRAPAMGLAAGGFFALSAIGFRGGVLALEAPNFVIAATTTLVTGLAMQTATLTLYLIVADRPTLAAILRLWRPSMKAGLAGAAASQFWFLGFATASAAQVRTLALVEVILAQIVSKRFFSQGASARELAGMALIVLGVAVLLNA